MTQTGMNMAAEAVPKGWRKEKFDTLFIRINTKKFQIQRSKYQNHGQLPVIDQGQNFIVAYTDEVSKKFHPLNGIIVFGDHTRFLKYVTFDFVIGADGTQLIDTTRLNKKFGYYLLSNTKIPNLGYSRHFKVLTELSFVVPSEPEQEKIVDILTTVDEAIEKTDSIIAQTESIKKSLMPTLLTKGLPGKHKKFKKTELGGIPDDWNIKKLCEIGSFLKGKGIAKNEVKDTGIPCVRYGEIYTTHHFKIKQFYSFIDANTANESTLIRGGDVLLAGSGETLEDIGKAIAYLGEGEAYAGGDTIILRVKNQNSLFLSYVLNSRIVRTQLNRLGQGHSVVHIYPRQLMDVQIPLPPLEEQTEIIQVLDELDHTVDVEKQKKAQLEKLKKGLMQVLLTGKVRVKVN